MSVLQKQDPCRHVDKIGGLKTKPQTTILAVVLKFSARPHMIVIGQLEACVLRTRGDPYENITLLKDSKSHRRLITNYLLCTKLQTKVL